MTAQDLLHVVICDTTDRVKDLGVRLVSDSRHGSSVDVTSQQHQSKAAALTMLNL